ncbi:hypothetical protein TCAL_14825 [Tigriopus californicus]|uniref:Uncharacterized protein n=2 Tax=Tigriopus californicus TaxID=6832 RepID=A0A553PR25_TIGCA|nr:hypothetical protein TCAL_14825 [Tigriopus californicus]
MGVTLFRLSVGVYFPGNFRHFGSKCDALARVKLAHRFSLCSEHKLKAVQSDLKVQVATQPWTEGLCDLIRGQVEECGQKLWIHCYGLDEVVHLQEAQLDAQYTALIGHDPKLGQELKARCQTFHRIGNDLHFLEEPQPMKAASSGRGSEPKDRCHEAKSEFLLCINDIHEALEYLIFSNRLPRALEVSNEAAICEAIRNFSRKCLPRLTECGRLEARKAHLVRDIARDQLAIYQELVAKKLSLPMGSLELDYALLLNKCR